MITDGDQPWAPPTTTNTLQCKIQFFVTCPDDDEDEPCKAGEDDCATDYIGDENEDEDEDGLCKVDEDAGLHKLWYPSIRDTSTWSKFGAHGEHGDVFLFSNLGAL